MCFIKRKTKMTHLNAAENAFPIAKRSSFIKLKKKWNQHSRCVKSVYDKLIGILNMHRIRLDISDGPFDYDKAVNGEYPSVQLEGDLFYLNISNSHIKRETIEAKSVYDNPQFSKSLRNYTMEKFSDKLLKLC